MYLDEIRVTEFTDESAGIFRRQVLEHSLNYPKDTIRVYIDSNGGEIDSLASMVATMESVPNKIHTICLGKAYSCGAFLLAMGDIRSASPYATIMVHEISAGTFGSTTEMENNLNEIKKQNKVWLTRFAKRCGKTYKEIVKVLRDNVNQDLFFTAKTAKRFGIIDRAHIPKPDFKLMKEHIKDSPEKKNDNSMNIFGENKCP